MSRDVLLHHGISSSGSMALQLDQDRAQPAPGPDHACWPRRYWRAVILPRTSRLSPRRSSGLLLAA